MSHGMFCKKTKYGNGKINDERCHQKMPQCLVPLSQANCFSVCSSKKETRNYRPTEEEST